MTPELRRAMRSAILETVRTEPGSTYAHIDTLITGEVENVLDDLATDGAVVVDADGLLHADDSADRCDDCGRWIDNGPCCEEERR